MESTIFHIYTLWLPDVCGSSGEGLRPAGNMETLKTHSSAATASYSPIGFRFRELHMEKPT